MMTPEARCRYNAHSAMSGAEPTPESSLADALRTSEQRFRALADAMPHLVWIANDAGVVEYYNARVREYGGVTERPDGTFGWEPLIHPDDAAGTAEAWQNAVATGVDFECEHRIRIASGDFRWHISRAHRVDESAGTRWYGTATDIHEQKLAQADLQRTVATRDQVVSVVAHDLRNPVAVVRLAVPLLESVVTSHPDGGARERGSNALARLGRQVHKLEKLLDELLDASRMQAGQPLALERAPVDLVALVRTLLTEHTTTVRRHQVQVRAPRIAVTGSWDAARIERVVENLITNAVKYSPAGSEILIDIEDTGPQAIFRVTDKGLGISERDLGRIFQWFARGENTESTTRGIGVGLAGARRIVEQHGGALTVESELGRGSTFTVRLPK